VLGGVVLVPGTWRRVVLGATILASKVWEEQSMWNADFIPIFDGLTAKDLQELERLYLNLLEFNVELSASEYGDKEEGRRGKYNKFIGVMSFFPFHFFETRYVRYYFNLQGFITNDPVQINEERAFRIQVSYFL
jgi:hypothetical protein